MTTSSASSSFSVSARAALRRAFRPFVLTAVAATLLGAAGCSPGNSAPSAAAPVAPEVPVVRARLQTEPDPLPFSGRIEARERVELRARVSGHLVEVAFDEGEIVRAGTTLFRIDARPFEARLDAAQSELAQAEADVRLAEQEWVRAETLQTTDSIAVEEVEQAAARLASARAARLAAHAAVASAKLDLEHTTVRAPIDGRVGRALVTAGNLVTAGESLLATQFSVEAPRVRFEIDEPTLHHLFRVATRERPRVRVTLQGMGDVFVGEVDYIDNAVDPSTGTVDLRASLVVAHPALLDGRFARVELLLPPAPGGVLVPETALGAAQGARYVLVADERNELVERRVTLGARHGELRSVIGVGPGEAIVTGGLQFLRPGIRIRPLETDTNASAVPQRGE